MMKRAWQLVLLSLALHRSEQATCKYGGRGSFASVCIEATSEYFKTTTYRFTHLDEQLECINCSLPIVDSNNFDFYDNRIKTLNLTNAQISVLKPKAFIGLLFLERLHLPFNKITTIAPLTFSGINKVQHLDMKNNKIGALVTDGLKELRNLKTLILRNNYIRIIETGAFNGLAALETLDMSNNYVNAIRQAFDGLTVASLNLENNEIKDIQPNDFSDPSYFLQINLAKNQIKSIPADTFLSFWRLEILDLSSNPIDAIALGSFRGLIALEDLDVSNASVSKVPKGTLLALRNLRTLDLSNNKIQSFATGTYSGLPELRKLNLSRNDIDTYVKTGVFSLSRLHTLDLSYNKLQDIDYKSLAKHMPTLSYLEMGNNPWRCYIAQEMQEEFAHDNVKFDLGASPQVQCNDTRSSYNDTGSDVTYASEVDVSSMVKPNGHEYVLYAFMVFSLGALGFMFYVQLKYRKMIKDVIASAKMAEARLVHSGDMACRDDY